MDVRNESGTNSGTTVNFLQRTCHWPSGLLSLFGNTSVREPVQTRAAKT